MSIKPLESRRQWYAVLVLGAALGYALARAVEWALL